MTNVMLWSRFASHEACSLRLTLQTEVVITQADRPSAVSSDRMLQRWTTALAAAGMAVAEFDAAAGQISLDGSGLGALGFRPSSSDCLPQSEWLALFAEEDRLTFAAAMEEALVDETTARLLVRAELPSISRLTYFDVSLRRIGDNSRVVIVLRDVTTELSHEEVRRQKLAAERSSQAKTEFMSEVSHELRTPLNAILGFAQMMALDSTHPLHPAQRERLEVLQHSGARLLGLIDQLLQIGRIEHGPPLLQPYPINVHDAVVRCVGELQVMAMERDLVIELDIEDATISGVLADPAAFAQVLSNLLSNAIKYNRQGGHVRVRFRAAEEGQLSVEDTGLGMSDSELGHLFEPFNRLSAAKTSVHGTGLGLVITRELVQAMGGRLEFWSEVGRGSRFQVSFPLASAPSRSISQDAAQSMPSRWDTGMFACVLYIEDDEVNALLMEQIFATQPDWELVVESSGRLGIAAALQRLPDLILLDMNLPDMSGAEILRELKSHPGTREIPCVAVSADAMPEHIERAIAQGADAYWTKPLDLRTTIERLKKLIP